MKNMILNFVTFFLSQFLTCLWTHFSEHVDMVREWWMKPQWVVPYSGWRRYLPTSVTSSQQLPWSLQDDQDASLWTSHVSKVSRWDLFQLVRWNCGIFFIIISTSTTLCHNAQCRNKWWFPGSCLWYKKFKDSLGGGGGGRAGIKLWSF